ncbi:MULTISPECIES: NAD-dependent epimerase/dehydratase family protein [Rossellomorea]|jgi:GDP-4-dehydro-6-deoxy-D-mannose reductase|uniref:NAD-dependent epimerase/dehydratase family protein n=1 Tax=Rossellomorea TaxID=2837508 RepID=UPI0011E957CC|nr:MULTISPECIES: NAD-dependent epimerase/dehydratase family protein [Rossellomorea]MDT9024015.1 GDP-mannose 4,6-dehydratase [Rossellomorea sp. YC4-1]TYS91226.1 NAD-dependent epimerase/dehydratase family protein [Rossellomorea aquimaris]
MSKVFITGASGFTGRHACEYYLNKGYEVYGAVRHHQQPRKQVQQVKCDLLNAEALSDILKSIQPRFILHLAAQNHSGRSWEDPISTMNTNVIGTMNLLEAVKKAVPQSTILIVGSVIEYNPCQSRYPNHPYGLSKYMQILVSSSWSTFYDLDVRIAKPSNLIGPGNSNGICSLLAQKCLHYRKDKSKTFHFHNILDHRDFLDVRDAIVAYDLILHKGKKNHSYTIARGETFTFLKIAKMLKELSHSDLPLFTEHFHHTPEIHFENSSLRQLFWKPTLSLQESLNDILEYFEDH